MEFKIDAKDTYTVITPLCTTLDATMSALLSDKCRELAGNGSANFIVDLHTCQNAERACIDVLVAASADMYEAGHSLVFTNLPAALPGLIKEEDAIDMLNYAPTFIEAVDIISMEILERDLFNEED